MSAHESGAVLVTLCVLALVYAFFRFTPLGLAMRAAAQNPVSSRLVGIRVGWMLAIGWGLAAAIGSVAGMMAAPIVYLDPNMMGGVLLYAFAGAVLGGIDNPFGAVVRRLRGRRARQSRRRLCRRRRGQALGRARDHHRRPGLAAVRTVRAPSRGEGLTDGRRPTARCGGLFTPRGRRLSRSPSRSSPRATTSIRARRCSSSPSRCSASIC